MINPLLILSQNGYPKEIVLNNTPLVAFTYDQVREINKQVVQVEYMELLIATTDSSLSQCNSLLSSGTLLINNLKSQVENYKKQETYYQEINLILEEKNKKLSKQIKRTKVWSIIGGVAAGAIITGLTVGIVTN